MRVQMDDNIARARTHGHDEIEELQMLFLPATCCMQSKSRLMLYEEIVWDVLQWW